MNNTTPYRRPFEATHLLIVTTETGRRPIQRLIGDSIRTTFESDYITHHVPIQLTGWHAHNDPQRVEYVTEHGPFHESKWACVEDLIPLPNTLPQPYLLPLREMSLSLHVHKVTQGLRAALGMPPATKNVRVESPSAAVH